MFLDVLIFKLNRIPAAKHWQHPQAVAFWKKSAFAIPLSKWLRLRSQDSYIQLPCGGGPPIYSKTIGFANVMPLEEQNTAVTVYNIQRVAKEKTR